MLSKEAIILIIDIVGHVSLFLVLLYVYLYIAREKLDKKERLAQQLNVRLVSPMVPLTPRAVLDASAGRRVCRQE